MKLLKINFFYLLFFYLLYDIINNNSEILILCKNKLNKMKQFKINFFISFYFL